jgi:hypothetical protein
MISFHYARKAKMAQGRSGAYCFGGSSKSDSSVKTTNQTDNYALSVDKRAVAQDSAVSLTGDGNTVNRNQTTNFNDSSNRSTTSLTSFVHTTVTDYGSVGAALNGMGAMTNRAFDSVDIGMAGAVDVLKLQTNEGYKAVSSAFAAAREASASAQANSAAVLGFASNMVDKTNAAFQQADDGGNSKMVMAAIVVVGAVGIAIALKD